MRSFGFTGGRSQGYLPNVPPSDPYQVSHAWVGAVTSTGVTVKFRSVDASAASLLVSTSPSLASPTTFTATEGNDDVWTGIATGLSANTTYYFGFDGNALAGTFTTWPTNGTAHSYLIALAGDGGLSATYPTGLGGTTNAPTFDRIREHDPLWFMHLGDLNYRNSNTTNPATYRNNYKDVLSASRFNQLVREVPTCYVWDDHDYCGNDTNGNAGGKSTAQGVFREYVPHWPLAESAAIYHTFVCGRVRFINLDSRSGRSPNSTTEGVGKTRLGATQKAWLKAQLLAATEPLIVLNILSWWGQTSSFSDGWHNFKTERQELAEFFEDNNLTSRILLIGADIHELAFDDGTNTQYDPDAVTPGPPYVQFAPIDATVNHFAATYQQRWQNRKQQYGTLEFTDTGSQITVTIRLYALAAVPGATSAQVFTDDLVYSG